VTTLEDLHRSPNALAGDYSAFRVADRLLLTGHSHQAWPDVAGEGQLEAFDDAARLVDEKWERAFAKADRVRAGFRQLLQDPQAQIALAENTHQLVLRFLSALDLRGRPRLVTSDGEFHTLRRQLARLGEEGFDVVRLGAEPADTLAERMAAAVDERTSAVLVSAVLFETARIVPHLDELAAVCSAVGAELLVDVYHALGVLPFTVAGEGLGGAWIVGGGYKYLQLGEGNCFLRIPEHGTTLRPVLTGWFAEFDELTAGHGDGAVGYGRGASRFAGSTYDPTSHYRAARVLDFFAERGLSPELLRAVSLHQTSLLSRLVDELALPETVLTRDRETPREAFGGFLALKSPQAELLARQLADAGVLTDARGFWLRLGPAPYLADVQLEQAVERLAGVVARNGVSSPP
jgi:kynureninase